MNRVELRTPQGGEVYPEGLELIPDFPEEGKTEERLQERIGMASQVISIANDTIDGLGHQMFALPTVNKVVKVLRASEKFDQCTTNHSEARCFTAIVAETATEVMTGAMAVAVVSASNTLLFPPAAPLGIAGMAGGSTGEGGVRRHHRGAGSASDPGAADPDGDGGSADGSDLGSDAQVGGGWRFG